MYLVLLLSALVFTTLSAPLPDSSKSVSRGLGTKYIVTFKKGVDAQVHTSWVRSIYRKRNTGLLGIENIFSSFPAYVGEFDDATIEIIKASPDVAAVEEDLPILLFSNKQPRALETQPSAQYGLGSISHREGSEQYVYDSTAGEGTYGYVVDSGINLEHVDFQGRASNGYNAYGGDHMDDDGHGTHVAGIMCSQTYGVAKNCNLISVKVFGNRSSSTSILLLGYDWALQDISWRERKDKSVINISIGTDIPSAAIDEAVKTAYENGIVTVVAAGNAAADASSISPARVPEVITVGALNGDLQRADYTNVGTSVDIFAAGNDLRSTWIGSDSATEVLSGTSVAAPHVAGLALYLQSLEGLKGPAAVADRIAQLSTKDQIDDTKDSPNRIAYNGSGR